MVSLLYGPQKARSQIFLDDYSWDYFHTGGSGCKVYLKYGGFFLLENKNKNNS